MQSMYDKLMELSMQESEKPVSSEVKKSSSPAQVSQPEKKGRQDVVSRHQDTATPTVTPTNQPTHHDTNQRVWVPESEEEYIEIIRKAVKQVGKEGGTYRFTLDEKNAMKQIKRYYEDQGIDTTDIEIIRMGLNYILEDFRQREEDSLLAKVMKKLKE